MSGYFIVLDVIRTTSILAYVALVFVEVIGKPRQFICRCPALDRHLPWHLRESLLLGACIASGAVATLQAALVVFQVEKPIELIWTALYGFISWMFYKWWKKHRGNKKGSLAKLLARVKVTASGLRVVPMPGKA